MRYNYDNYNYDSDEYQVYDSCYGEVTSRCNTGIFLRLDNGQEAFSTKMRNLKVGDKVLCTVLDLATATKRLFVSADSVVEYAAA